MRTRRLELLRPEEILDEMQRCPVVYLPLAPLEWHGPHLPCGVDPLIASELARRLADALGGLVETGGDPLGNYFPKRDGVGHLRKDN